MCIRDRGEGGNNVFHAAQEGLVVLDYLSGNFAPDEFLVFASVSGEIGRPYKKRDDSLVQLREIIGGRLLFLIGFHEL